MKSLQSYLQYSVPQKSYVRPTRSAGCTFRLTPVPSFTLIQKSKSYHSNERIIKITIQKTVMLLVTTISIISIMIIIIIIMMIKVMITTIIIITIMIIMIKIITIIIIIIIIIMMIMIKTCKQNLILRCQKKSYNKKNKKIYRNQIR